MSTLRGSLAKKVISTFAVLQVVTATPLVFGAPTTITNQRIGISLDPSDGNMTSIRDSNAQHLIQIRNEVPWRIQFRSIQAPFTDRRLLAPRDMSCPVPSHVLVAGGGAEPQQVRVLWSSCRIDTRNSVDVELRLVLPNQSTFAQAFLQVDASGTGSIIAGSTSRTRDFGIESLSLYLSPLELPSVNEYGLLTVRSVHGVVEPGLVLTQQNIPATRLSNSFSLPNGITDFYPLSKISAYWREEGPGLLVFPEQSDGSQPVRLAYRSVTQADNSRSFQIAISEYMPEDLLAGGQAQFSFPLRLQPFFSAHLRGGDIWHVATRLYKDYLESSTQLFRKGLVLQRTDIPQHLKSGDSIIGYWGPESDGLSTPWSNDAFQNRVVEMYAQTRERLGLQLYTPFFFIGWNEYSGVAHSRYQPRLGQTQLFRKLGARGLNPYLYVLGGAINPSDPLYARYHAASVLDEFGNPRTFSGDPIYGTYVDMDNSATAWGEYVASSLEPLVRGSDGATGIYWDSPFHHLPSYRVTAQHPAGNGAYVNRGTAATLEALESSFRSINPNYMSITENNPEFAASSVSSLGADGAYYLPPTFFEPHAIRYLIGAGRDMLDVKFATQLLHQYIPLIGVQAMFAYNDPINDYQYFQGKTCIEGGGVLMLEELGKYLGTFESLPALSERTCQGGDALCSTAKQYGASELRWAHALISLRRRFPEFMIAGELMPRVESTIPSRAIVNQLYPGVDFQFQVISNAVWRSPDGEYALVFGNSSDQEHTFTWTFDRERFEAPMGTEYILSENNPATLYSEDISTSRENFQHSTTLSPKSVLVYVIRPKKDFSNPVLNLETASGRRRATQAKSVTWVISANEAVTCTEISGVHSAAGETAKLHSESATRVRLSYMPLQLGNRELRITCSDREGNRSTISVKLHVRKPELTIKLKRRPRNSSGSTPIIGRVVSTEVDLDRLTITLEQQAKGGRRMPWEHSLTPDSPVAPNFSIPLPAQLNERTYRYRIVLRSGAVTIATRAAPSLTRK